jgi:outer membrane protein
VKGVARRFLLLAGAGLAAAPAQADDLRGALVQAYDTNPTLQAARANLRATDEGVPIARADGLPSLNSQASETEYVRTSALNFTSPERQVAASVTLGVPIYSGGAVRNGVKAADTRVGAGQADLRGTESSVFSQVVAAYMDVIQNQAIVGLNRNNVQVLEVNLQATSDRFEIGDLTRTDVAQSRSRLELAKSNTRAAESNLISSRERYIQVVGKPPVDLEPPPPLPGLPATVDDAVAIALDNNPDLLAAHERRKAATFDTRVAGASRLPKVTIFADGGYSNYLGTYTSLLPGATQQSATTADVGVRATFPLFQGGRPAAQRRQAQQREDAAMENEIGTERSVIAQVRSTYSSWKAANEIIVSSQSAVDAATLSLEGVRAENSVGNRTILDILNAEQELLGAQVQLVTARRNAYVAGFSLLAAMGKAEAQDLGLEGATLYDPDVHYHRVRGKWFDWDDDPAPKAQSTRTVDTPAQTGAISGQ